jgi:ketosteroid isomerase-like protein
MSFGILRNAMTQSREVVQRMYDAFHGGDVQGAMAYFDADVVVDPTTTRVDVGVSRGHEGLIEVIGRWIGGFDEWQEEIEVIRDLGSRVYVTATQHGRAKGTGAHVETRYAVVYELHGGMITRVTMFSDPAEALEVATAQE